VLCDGKTANHVVVQCDKHSFTQLPSDTARQAIANPLGVITPDGALVCVKVGMVSKGIPNTRARIYRLPADNSKLKAQWLSISRLDGNKVCDNRLTHKWIVFCLTFRSLSQGLRAIHDTLWFREKRISLDS
jgi:hypothetical protein